MPRRKTPNRRRRHNPSPHSTQYGRDYIESMALRGASYLDKFDDYASQIRDNPDLEDAYNNLIRDGLALPASTPFVQCKDAQGREQVQTAMEDILCRQGVSTEEYVATI